MTQPGPELREQLGHLANLELYAIFMAPTDRFQDPSTPAGERLLSDHLKFLFQLQEHGELLAAGPLDLDVGRMEGMCIVRADSRAAAEAIAEREPYAATGWRTNTVRVWQLNEGLLVNAVREVPFNHKA